MLDNRAKDTIADRLVADAYRRDHQLIFEAIAELAGRNQADASRSGMAGTQGVAEETGGLVCLAGLVRILAPPTTVRTPMRCAALGAACLITVGGGSLPAPLTEGRATSSW